ncbi:hypothetical protein DL766_002862 [Monosporascus sp. MC13-8B]|uniref:Uncharacterized protein n=1 Tax=Monosporascus cannonballus TaxID=155416 RepID=A0ABY0HDM5_9PEZI|nr:hypothetical protein DL762_002552 [Monosporascus cannonballus]RYO95197.1 hypothetical protein DL763_003765 [Monosporascus cannonballus]RYP34671.1 hypothetical protein DL766_002862 [Monosporascus sp. MC13-8B]
MAVAASKIVLVTGANNGIGYETAKALLQSDRAYHIFLGSRSLERAKRAVQRLREEVPAATNTVEILPVDLTSDQSIENAFEQVKSGPGRLDILINNAVEKPTEISSSNHPGAIFDMEFLAGRVSLRECFNRAYDVNVAGTNVLTWTFVPLLLRSADPRLLFVGGLSDITQAGRSYFPTPPQPAGWPKNIDFETIGYRCSKTALNMLMLDWNHKLKTDGVKVWAVAPGILDTGLGNLSPEMKERLGLKHASAGGRILRSVAEGERDNDVGRYIGHDGELEW